MRQGDTVEIRWQHDEWRSGMIRRMYDKGADVTVGSSGFTYVQFPDIRQPSSQPTTTHQEADMATTAETPKTDKTQDAAQPATKVEKPAVKAKTSKPKAVRPVKTHGVFIHNPEGDMGEALLLGLYRKVEVAEKHAEDIREAAKAQGHEGTVEAIVLPVGYTDEPAADVAHTIAKRLSIKAAS